jgi:hypothetical protein
MRLAPVFHMNMIERIENRCSLEMAEGQTQSSRMNLYHSHFPLKPGNGFLTLRLEWCHLLGECL